MQRYLLVCTILFFSVLSTYAQKLEYEDRTYDKNIKTVHLYPDRVVPYPEFEAPVISFDQRTPLLLRFDELYYDFTQYYVKIYHCQHDWTPSRLSDMEFLNEYNEFPIQNFEYSQNTKVPYTTYTTFLPKVRIPGNYVVAVYREDTEDQLILSKRFVVFNSRVEIYSPDGLSTAIRNQVNNQMIEFGFSYRDLEAFSPMQDFKVAIRKNQRWNTLVSDFKPSMIREDQKNMEFRFFGEDRVFSAGNEYRFFDLRGYTYRGANVAAMESTQDFHMARLNIDQSRKGLAYRIYDERNGQYYIQTLEAGAPITEADYIKVTFTLEAEERKEDVYVIGAFNQWRLEKDNKMQYDKRSGTYTTTLLLKQGYYNYLYWVDGDDPYYFEGNHFETNNQYEIFIYHRAPGALMDIPVGYLSQYSGVR